MAQRKRDDVHRLLIQARKLGCTESVAFRRLFRVLTIDPFHPTARPLIERMVAKAQATQELYGTPFDPPPTGLHGPIVPGRTSSGRPAPFGIEMMEGNMLCLGQSGSGKSNLLLVLAPQLAAAGKTFWTFELSKGEQQRSYWLFEHLGCALVIMRDRDWIANILEVPFGVRIETWIVRCVEILSEALQIPDAAQDLLTQSIIQLYKQFSVFSGSTFYPTLPELVQHIEGQARANPQARSVLLRRLNLLLLELPHNMTGYRRSYDIRELVRHHLHFVLHGASQHMQSLIVLHLVASLFEYRNALDRPNRGLEHIICLEEAQRFLTGSRNPYIGYLFSMVRGVGISFGPVE